MADQTSSQTDQPSALIQSSKGKVDRVTLFTTRNLSVIVSGAVAITALVKADTKDIPKIVEMLTKSDTSAVLGWAIASIILIGSVFMVRVLMKIHDREIERLVQERDLLQKKLLASPGEHL